MIKDPPEKRFGSDAFPSELIEDALRRIGDQFPSIIWTHGADGRVDYFNRRWYEVTGLAPGTQPTREQWTSILPLADLQRIRALFRQARAEGCAYETTARVKPAAARESAYRWHLIRIVPIRKSDRIVRWIGAATDIHDQKAAADKREATFRDIANLMPQMMFTMTPQGGVDWCNARFHHYLGLPPTALAPRNFYAAVHADDCTELQERWRKARRNGMPFEMECRIRGSDGEYRWFLQRVVPLRSASGKISKWYGSHTYIDDRRRADDALRLLAQSEYVALGERRSVTGIVKRFARIPILAEFADWCSVFVAGKDGNLELIATSHREPAKEIAFAQLMERYPMDGTEAATAFRESRAILTTHVGARAYAAAAYDAAHLRDLRKMSVHSSISVPLVSRGITIGVVNFANAESRRSFREGDLTVATILAKRAADVIDNARLAQEEFRATQGLRALAAAFQRASLPGALPQANETICFSAVYSPALADAQIGGDWYDAFELSEGRYMVSIGDVAGRGIEAAVIMATARQAIRTLALHVTDPNQLLDEADVVLRGSHPDSLVTALVGIVDTRNGVFDYASAGHPAPMLRLPDGSIRELDCDGLPLGLRKRGSSRTRRHAIAPRSVLLLYTDGLIESTHRLDVGFARLAQVLATEAVVHASNPARLIQESVLFDGSPDDVAVLAISFAPPKQWRFDAEDAAAGHEARAEFVRYLREEGIPEADFASAELIFGELVGNVVRHAPGPIEIAVSWDDEGAVLHVIDRGPGFSNAPVLPADIMSDCGRGLFLIASAARSFAASSLPGRGTHALAALNVARRSSAGEP